MAIWPETSKPLANGYDNTPLENVRRSPSESGNTQIRDLWAGATKFKAEFEMQLSFANSRIAISFYNTNRGTTVTFFDFDWTMEFTAENIGTGDGSALNFTIPAKETTSHAENAQPLVYVNGVLKTVATHYNITAGSGALGEDRVIFTGGNAPPNGHAVTITYSGRHRYAVDIITCTWKTISSTGRKHFSVRVEEAW